MNKKADQMDMAKELLGLNTIKNLVCLDKQKALSLQKIVGQLWPKTTFHFVLD